MPAVQFSLPSFKMSDRSLFAVLLRSPWWISFAVAAAVGFACYSLFPARFAAVGAVSGLPFAVIGVMAAWRQWQAPSPAKIDATLQTLAALPGRDFVTALERAYVADGYTVTRFKGSGADWIISKGSRSALVSHQRWKAANHGVEPLRELSAALASPVGDDVGQGIYIALNAPSDAARQFAAKSSLRIVTGTELALLMQATVNSGTGSKRAA